MKVYDNITQVVGNTPLIRLRKIAKGLPGNIIAKAEFFNPLSSIKDRVGMAMIESAEKTNLINKDTVIIEATSGNTGIALAFICAVKGYKLIITMPDNMSRERVKLLRILGADVVLTPGDKGMDGANQKAREIAEQNHDSFIASQFDNPANPGVHKKNTAVEILNDMENQIDVFVAGIGTGGTVTGMAEAFMEHGLEVKIVGVEPEYSAVISGGTAGEHKIQGIGAGFIPNVLKKECIDEIIKISDEEAKEYACRLAREEGILAGISSGANVAASCRIASRKENKDKNIVTILCDTGERYLSGWLFDDY
ncbi:MAG: cysteine synthase A [Candidatus Omnitrophota bacterium]